MSRPLADKAAATPLRIFCGKVSMVLIGCLIESRDDSNRLASATSVLIHY